MTGSTRKPDALDVPQDDSAAAPRVSDAAQEQVSRQLRAFYEGIQEEGIPDRFMDLLDRLDQAEKAAQSRD